MCRLNTCGLQLLARVNNSSCGETPRLEAISKLDSFVPCELYDHARKINNHKTQRVAGADVNPIVFTNEVVSRSRRTAI